MVRFLFALPDAIERFEIKVRRSIEILEVFLKVAKSPDGNWDKTFDHVAEGFIAFLMFQQCCVSLVTEPDGFAHIRESWIALTARFRQSLSIVRAFSLSHDRPKFDLHLKQAKARTTNRAVGTGIAI